MQTVLRAKCQHCEAEFKGIQSPRKIEDNAICLLNEHVSSVHPEVCFTCPRRSESIYGLKGGQNKDYWNDDAHCSYCGSAQPQKLFAKIEAGEILTPTDKNYKVYLPDYEKFYFQHLVEEEMLKFISLFNDKKIKTNGSFYVLPYFMILKTLDNTNVN